MLSNQLNFCKFLGLFSVYSKQSYRGILLTALPSGFISLSQSILTLQYSLQLRPIEVAEPSPLPQ